MSTYTDIFSGFNVQPSQSSYSSYTFGANLTLSWPLQFIDTSNIVSNIIDLNASGVGLFVNMPDATQAGNGSSVIFNNIGPIVTVRTNQSTNIITLGASQSAFLYLIDNTTIAGTWRTVPFGGGFVSVTSVAAVSASNNLVIAGSPITSSGTFNFSLANDLLVLSTFGGGTGLSARTGANTWSLRVLTGTANQISIVNGDGILGNPTFSLPTTITGINNLTVGNINLNANSITTINANGDLTITPNGTGLIRLFTDTVIQAGKSFRFYNTSNNGYVGFKGGESALGTTLIWTLPLLDGTNGQVIQTNGANVLSFASVVNFAGASTNNAIAKFNGIAGSIQNSGVIIDAANNVTGMNTLTVGNLGIATTGVNIITSTNANGPVSVVPNGNGLINLTVGAAAEIANTGITTLRPLGGVVSPVRFYNTTNTFYTELVAGNPGANVSFKLPLVDGGVNSLMLTDSAGNLGFTPAGAGKLVLISSQTAAASANISFSSGSGTFPVYNSYHLIIRDLIPSNNDVMLYITVSTDGGATYAAANYNYTFNWSSPVANITNNSSSGAAAARIIATVNVNGNRLPNPSTAPFNGVLKILNASGGNYTSFVLSSVYQDTTGNSNSFDGQGTYAQAIAVNGIRFSMSAGSIASGVFTLYGLNT